MNDKNLEDHAVEPAPKLIEVLLLNCKQQVDHWIEPYIRLTLERLRRTERPFLKCLLMQVVSNIKFSMLLWVKLSLILNVWFILQIADALYYNASLTLNILQKIGVTNEVFNLWFQMLQQTKNSGARANFKR